MCYLFSEVYFGVAGETDLLWLGRVPFWLERVFYGGWGVFQCGLRMFQCSWWKEF